MCIILQRSGYAAACFVGLLLVLLFVGVLCLVLALLFNILCSSSYAIILIGKRELVALH